MSVRILAGPRLWIGAGLFLSIMLLLLSPFDLAVSKRVARPDAALGQFFRIYGLWPFFPVYFLCLLQLAVSKFRKRSRILSHAASAIVVQALGLAWIVTGIFKWLWGRTRFYNLNSDFSNYMSIFDFKTGGAGVSFTSGHVATSLVTLPVVIVLARYGKERAAIVLLLCNVVYGVFMAYARMLAGAHYLTDVLGAMALSCLFAPLSVYLAERYLRLFDKSANNNPV